MILWLGGEAASVTLKCLLYSCREDVEVAGFSACCRHLMRTLAGPGQADIECAYVYEEFYFLFLHALFSVLTVSFTYYLLLKSKLRFIVKLSLSEQTLTTLYPRI